MNPATLDARLSSTSQRQSFLPINRWFLWKEFRQLTPLVVVLLTAALVVIFFQSEFFTSAARLSPVTFLVFPGLFAVGAGTVLVGQEREHRTMDWLTTLPIPSRNLVLVKFTVSMVGLVLMWCLALLTMTLYGIGQDDSSNWLTYSRGRIASNQLVTLVRYPMWIVHSIYVLLCSFFASWRIKNQFIAIVLVAPLACIPLLFSETVLEGMYLASGQHLKPASMHWTRIVVSLLAVPLMGLLSYHAALRALSPQSGPSFRIVITRLSASKSAEESVTPSAPTFGSPTMSIVWQAMHSAPLVWIALLSMTLGGVCLPWLGSAGSDRMFSYRVDNPWTLISTLAVCWLGVSVFKNDGAAERLQFLADRGISPLKIFIGRHAIPLGIISLGLIAYGCIATYQSANATEIAEVRDLPSLLTVTLVAMVIYSVSQWMSQIVQMMILAAIIAPVASFCALSWWSTVARHGAPTWMLGMFAVLPMLATCCMMPRFMDMRDRPRSFILGFGIAFAMFALPVVPQFWQLVQVSRSNELPDYEKLRPLCEKIVAESKSASSPIRLLVAHKTTSGENMVTPSDATESDAEALDSVTWKSTVEPDEFLIPLTDLKQQPDAATTIPEPIWTALIDRLMWERLKFTQSPAETRSETIRSFADWIETASVIAQRLRLNPKWYDQEIADRLEVWLVDVLKNPELQPYELEPFFLQAAARFPERSQRSSARLRGVILSWQNWSYPTPEERKAFGFNRDPMVDRLAEDGYSLSFGIWMMSLESIAACAIETLETDGAAIDGRSWQRRMHRAVFYDRIPFELGPYSDRIRLPRAVTTIEREILYPARFWFLEWEDDAAALRKNAISTLASLKAEGEAQ